MADNSFDVLEVTAVWGSDVRSPKCLLAMLVAAYNALQRNKLQVLNAQVEAAELGIELNMHGEQIKGGEMLQDKDKSCNLLRRVFVRVFMYKKMAQWLVKEINSDTDTACVSVPDVLDAFCAVGKELWTDDLATHTDAIPKLCALYQTIVHKGFNWCIDSSVVGDSRVLHGGADASINVTPKDGSRAVELGVEMKSTNAQASWDGSAVGVRTFSLLNQQRWENRSTNRPASRETGLEMPCSVLATCCGSKSLKVILIDSDFRAYPVLTDPLVTLYFTPSSRKDFFEGKNFFSHLS